MLWCLFPIKAASARDPTSRPLRFAVVREYLVANAPGETSVGDRSDARDRRTSRVIQVCRTTRVHRDG
jgi:hypothetical protein